MCTFLLHHYCQQVCAVTVYSCVLPLSWRAYPIPTLPSSLSKTGRSVPAWCTLQSQQVYPSSVQWPHQSWQVHSSPVPLPLPCQSQWECAIHTGAGFSFATHLVATEELSGNIGQDMSSLHTLSLQLAGTSQKGAYILIWNPNFCSSFPGDACSSPGLEASRIYNCSSRGLYILVYVKSCC